jgi:hypothetical protein
MAQVAAERINQAIDPERSIDHIQSPEELPFSKPDEQ